MHVSAKLRRATEEGQWGLRTPLHIWALVFLWSYGFNATACHAMLCCVTLRMCNRYHACANARGLSTRPSARAFINTQVYVWYVSQQTAEHFISTVHVNTNSNYIKLISTFCWRSYTYQYVICLTIFQLIFFILWPLRVIAAVSYLIAYCFLTIITYMYFSNIFGS